MNIKKTLRGTYGDHMLPIHIFNAPKSKNILVNIHGSYGDLYSGSKKFLRLAQSLSSNNTAHVVLYQSTREIIPSFLRKERIYIKTHIIKHLL